MGRAPRGIGRREHRHAHAHHFAVGVGPSVPTLPPPLPVVPAGFAPVFSGWNVWDVWQADKPSFDVMNLGLSLERQLKIWVENAVKDDAPGSAVADPANPLALRGAQVQPIPHVTDLAIAATRADIPELANASLNSAGNSATLRTVRFWSRASVPRFKLASSMPWPHNDDYLLNVVYQPTAKSAVTNAPQPGSLAGAASDLASGAGSALTLALVGGAVVLAAVVAISFANARKAAA